MDFSEALKLVRSGCSITREGWNGKGQFIQLQVPDPNSKMGLPYLYITTVDSKRVPWLASQTDLLADDWAEVDPATDQESTVGNDDGGTADEKAEEAKAVEKPKDKRVVRTKSSGDRVYYLDEVKKQRQWVYNPNVLQSLGFDMSDVVEIEDSELLRYGMGPAILKPIVEPDAAPQS